MNVEPTRGMNKSTGRELTGQDVSRERQTEQIADAVKPLTGLSREQFEVKRRRINLPGAVQSECTALDSEIEQLEKAEQTAAGEARSMAC